MTKRDVGNIGEDAAAVFLEHHGYEILARGYTVRGGEIDIIARKGGNLVFVEVKTRKFDSLTDGETAVGKNKRRHIIKAADVFYREYVKEHGRAKCRFDVAVVKLKDGKIKEAKYYVSAFDSDGNLFCKN